MTMLLELILDSPYHFSDSLKEEKVEFENMTRKLKQMIMKLKKENGDTKKQVEELEQAETSLQKTIDEMILTQDESKIEIARLTAEKTTLKEQVFEGIRFSSEIFIKVFDFLFNFSPSFVS